MTAEDWTITSLKAYLEALIVAERDHVDTVVDRIDSRHTQFDQQAQRLQSASNEWRGALQDRERNTVSRVEFDTRTKAIEDKSDVATSTNGALIAALGAEMRAGFANIDQKTSQALETLRLRNAETAGGRKSLDDARIWILAALAAASIVFNIVLALH